MTYREKQQAEQKEMEARRQAIRNKFIRDQKAFLAKLEAKPVKNAHDQINILVTRDTIKNMTR